VGIEEFPLAWRWTQVSHAVLAPEVLASLTPLHAHDAEQLYRRGERLFPQGTVAAVTHQAFEDPEPTRAWLEVLPIARDGRVLIAWNRETAISLPWKTFVAYWNDFCYPSSDDAFVFPEEGMSALAWNHYEVFEFIENAV
jgi:hypothetical protein